MPYKHVPFTQRPCGFWKRHRWAKWCDVFEGREAYIPLSEEKGYPIVIQERRCGACNKVERRVVRAIYG